MRTRLLRGVLAATLAAMIGATGAVRPAQADDPPCEYVIPCPPRMPPAGPVVTFVFALYNLLRAGASAANLEALIQAAISALDQATNEVIVHIDAYQAARAQSDAINADREFGDFERMLEDDLWLGSWAQKIGDCATDVTRDLNVVEDDRAADQMGHAVLVLYPVALVGHEFAGLVNGGALLDRAYVEVTKKIIRDLAPVCSYSDVPLAPPSMYAVERTHTCVAADGNAASAKEFVFGGVPHEPAVNLDQLRVDSAVHSSWLEAVRILPTIEH